MKTSQNNNHRIMPHILLVAAGTMLIRYLYLYQIGGIIACAILCVFFYAILDASKDKPAPVVSSTDSPRRLNNPRLAEVMASTDQLRPKPGMNFHMNGLQFEIVTMACAPGQPDVVSRLDVVCKQPGVPNVPLSLAYPSLMPWGGEELRKNEDKLRRLYAFLKVSNEEKSKA